MQFKVFCGVTLRPQVSLMIEILGFQEERLFKYREDSALARCVVVLLRMT